MKPGFIVNADDLGIDGPTSRGIVSAFHHGIVSSATLMVTMPAAEEAAAAASAAGMPLGLHISLTQGRAAAPRDCYRLIDASGMFMLTPQHLIRSGRNDATLLKQIRDEIRAQLAKAVDMGIALTHVDSHHHVHMNPAIFGILEDEALAFGVRRIRFAREPLRALFLWGVYSQIVKRNNLPKWLVTRAYATRIRPRLETPDLFFGILNSGAMIKRVLLNLIASIPSDKSVEICVHPGLLDPSSAKSSDRFEAFSTSVFRQLEYDALVDPDVGALIRNRGLVLQSFDGKPKPAS